MRHPYDISMLEDTILPLKEIRRMNPIFGLLHTIIQIYIYLLIGNAILSWLVAFNVVNTRNQFVYKIGEFLHKITDPVLRPIRKVIPYIGGIDISPVVLILGLMFLQNSLIYFA